MGTRDVVDFYDDMNFIRSVWFFKVNQYPGGLINIFQSLILCSWGHSTQRGYLFETDAPVVQRIIVRLILILGVLLQLKSNKGVIIAAFLHAKLEENEKDSQDTERI